MSRSLDAYLDTHKHFTEDMIRLEMGRTANDSTEYRGLEILLARIITARQADAVLLADRRHEEAKALADSRHQEALAEARKSRRLDKWAVWVAGISLIVAIASLSVAIAALTIPALLAKPVLEPQSSVSAKPANRVDPIASKPPILSEPPKVVKPALLEPPAKEPVK